MIVELEVKEKNLLIELDTGAALPLIFISTRSELFPNVPLRNTSTILTTYMRQQISMRGGWEAGDLGALWGEGLEPAIERGGGKWARFAGEMG